jgi:hypothetical protein
VDVLNWQPGENGKGIVDQDGHVHTWNEEDYEVHGDYLRAFPELQALAYFYITPKGEVDVTMPSRHYGEADKHHAMTELICEADPHLYPDPNPGDWDF